MQTQPTFNDKLETLLSERLGIEKEDLNLHSNLTTDLNLGEVEKADLISYLEKALNFSIEDKSSMSKLTTLEDLIHLIEENSNEF